MNFTKAKFLTLVLAVLLVTPVSAASPTKPDLAAAANFAVLTASGLDSIINNGATTLNGSAGDQNVGSAVGFGGPTDIVTFTNGSLHEGDELAEDGGTSLVDAYQDAEALTGATVLAGSSNQLTGQTLVPGLYSFASTAGATNLAGTLTLDAAGDPNGVWVFQTGDDLVAASGCRVNLVNGAQSDNVFWQVGGTVLLGSNCSFVGNVMAMGDIEADSAVTLRGRLLSVDGEITLNADNINFANLSSSVTPAAETPTATNTSTPLLPAAGNQPVNPLSIIIIGFIGLMFFLAREAKVQS